MFSDVMHIILGTSNSMSNTLKESPMRIVGQDECRRSYSDIINTQICVESATSSACTVSCLVSEYHEPIPTFFPQEGAHRAI